ncbi:hypothetical protein M569_05871, partial [Genlisea aurea]
VNGKNQHLSPGNGSLEIDIWPHLRSITSDAISRTAFDNRYEDGRKIFELQRELTKYVINNEQSLYIPLSRFLPTKSNRRMKRRSRKKCVH